jgi:CDP-paratose 2-epimerase
VRDVLQQRSLAREVWITETGYSTWRHDHRGQLRAYVEAAEAPAERVYWYSLNDLDPDRPTVSGFHLDDREYHFGVRYADGRPKTLHRLWAGGGLEAVRRVLTLATGQTPAAPMPRQEGRAALPGAGTAGRSDDGHVLVTGGAGFVGTNLAHRYASEGHPVLVYDNLDRPGAERNLAWLKAIHGDLVRVSLADVRDRYALRAALRGAVAVYHLAAQVAVTTSLVNPLFDHEVNVVGTMGLLEELRRLESPPPLVFTSTNKVYGGLEDIVLTRNSTRYQPEVPGLRTRGVSEERPLSFQSPYGCSKGAADQYVRDYAHTYNLPAVVFRMSCIYGPHQNGTEDQGWIAHFVIRAIQNLPISIFGDGMQVRDALYVDDLVDALRVASEIAPQRAGEVLNVGGGPAHTLSLLELLQLIEKLHGSLPAIRFLDWRVGDQRYYVSDVTRIGALTGWQPQVDVVEGVTRLYHWLRDQLASDEGAGRSGGLALLDGVGAHCDDRANQNG